MGWIKCSERMPEDHSEVIVAWPDTGDSFQGWKCVGTAWFDGVHWLCVENGEPLRQDATHWQPLPEPPND